MDTELTQRQQVATSSTNEEQPPTYERFISEITTPASVRNLPSNNIDSGVSTNSAPQLQQQQRDVAIDVDARFGPSCAPILSDAEIVKNIIQRSQREDFRQRLHLFKGCLPSFVIMCAIWITWAAIGCKSDFENDCSNSNFLYYAGIGLACLTGLIILWALMYGGARYLNEDRYATLQNNVRHVIKLQGNVWTKYVEYLYGYNRADFNYMGNVGGVSFCCRKSHYKELIARGYGYIVFCQRGFILDEVYHIVRNEPHIVLKVMYIAGLGLRVYLVRGDGKYAVRRDAGEEARQQAALAAVAQQMVPLDIYLPNTIPPNVVALLALQIQYGL